MELAGQEAPEDQSLRTHKEIYSKQGLGRALSLIIIFQSPFEAQFKPLQGLTGTGCGTIPSVLCSGIQAGVEYLRFVAGHPGGTGRRYDRE